MKIMKNNRAITPIISIVLLLMMTIAIAGLGYSWLQRMQVTIQTSSENTSTRLLEDMNVELIIVGYNLECNRSFNNDTNLTFFLRNAGTDGSRNLQLFVDDVYQAGKSTSALAQGGKLNLTYSASENCSDWENSTKKVSIVSDEVVMEKTIKFKCSSGSC